MGRTCHHTYSATHRAARGRLNTGYRKDGKQRDSEREGGEGDGLGVGLRATVIQKV